MSRSTVVLKSAAFAVLAAIQFAPLHAQEVKHDVVSFISGGAAGTWFPTATVIAEMVNEAYSGQPMSSIPGKGAIGNALAVGSGRADFGLSYGPFLLAIYSGENEILEQPGLKNLRAIASVVPNTAHIILAGNIEGDAFATAKEKPLKIGVGSKGSTNIFGLEKLLLEYGADFEVVNQSGGFTMEGVPDGLLDAFMNRQIDVYTNTVGIGASDIQQALATRDSRLMPIPEDIRDKMVKNWGYVKFDIPAGTYPNQEESVPALDLATVIITTEDMDDEIVYNMVKAMAVNKGRLVSAYGGFDAWEPASMPKGHPIPTHPGALKYYKEAGWIN